AAGAAAGTGTSTTAGACATAARAASASAGAAARPGALRARRMGRTGGGCIAIGTSRVIGTGILPLLGHAGVAVLVASGQRRGRRSAQRKGKQSGIDQLLFHASTSGCIWGDYMAIEVLLRDLVQTEKCNRKITFSAVALPKGLWKNALLPKNTGTHMARLSLDELAAHWQLYLDRFDEVVKVA